MLNDIDVDRVAQHDSSNDHKGRLEKLENHVEVHLREHMARIWGLSIIGCRGGRGGRDGRSRLCLAGIKTSKLNLGKERRANTLDHVIVVLPQATRHHTFRQKVR